MTDHPLSGDYLRWLAPQIRREDDGHPNRTYEGLIELMFDKEFVWLVPNDDNRVADGLGLRIDFCRQVDIPTDSLVDLGPCSFLEVLIALSRRLEFNGGGSAAGWAWILMNNLQLHRITDPVGRSKARRANDIMDACIWRTYSYEGVGGFFPLKRAAENQCKVEIWYQMAAYLGEHPEG